jgi:hypothetical protein
MLKFLKSLFGGGAGGGLDPELVARVHDSLTREPSDRLREMIDPAAADRWYPEAVQAARRLLDRRAKNLAPEPVYRTAPRPPDEQAARERERVAPGFDRRLLALDVGSRVYCGWRGRHGTIIRWKDGTDEFYIRYDNGEGDWADLSKFG